MGASFAEGQAANILASRQEEQNRAICGQMEELTAAVSQLPPVVIYLSENYEMEMFGQKRMVMRTRSARTLVEDKNF